MPLQRARRGILADCVNTRARLAGAAPSLDEDLLGPQLLAGNAWHIMRLPLKRSRAATLRE